MVDINMIKKEEETFFEAYTIKEIEEVNGHC